MSAKNDRGSNLPPIKKKDDEMSRNREKFVAKNWKTIPAGDMKKMTPLQRSRYQAYEEPPKNVSNAQQQTLRRLVDLKKQKRRDDLCTPKDEVSERNKHEKLIGQLKAAEARNRLRIMRIRYQANRGQEISHLISCQPTALKAVRLQALVPSPSGYGNRPDLMDKLDRQRVECLLEDKQGLLVNRT